MAKFQQKILARKLRHDGKSIREIANKTQVSKGTASIWCRDIKLNKKQLKVLEAKQIKGGYKGRLKGAETQKRRRLEEIEFLKSEGIKEVSKLTKNEFFIAGIAIYWAEGHKTGHKCGFSNSDSKLVLFMLKWLEKCCDVSSEDIICQVGINESHINRVKEVEKYWSNLTKIPLPQFTRTSLKKVKAKKIYDNHDQHFGTLRVEVRKSSKKLRRILGWIEGLYLGRE